MMKIRSISYLLLAAMLTGILVTGCGDSGKTGTDTTADGNSGETTAPENPLDALDYGGKTFTISMSATGISSHKLMMGPEESTGDILDDATYERNLTVEERLGIEFEYVETQNNHQEVKTYVQTMVFAGDDTFDLIVDDQYGLFRASVEGLLTNAKDLEYFNFEKDGWWTEYMENLSIRDDKLFLLVGDYFINVFDRSHVLYVNWDLMTEVSGMDKAALYDMILTNKWTYDKMNNFVAAAYHDVNGNTTRDVEDQFGLMHTVIGGTMYPYFYGSDSPFTERDSEGNLSLTLNNERSHLLYEKINALINKNEGTFLNNYGEDSAEHRTTFSSGNVMLLAENGIGNFPLFRDITFDMGIMPYPLLDESQERYRTVVHDTAEVGCIPASAKDPDMSSAVTQMLCELSYELFRPAYYESTLKVKHARDDDTAKIIDLIYNGIYSQFELVAGSEYFYNIFTRTFLTPLQQKGDSIAAEYASRETAALENLEKLLTTFPK